MDLVPRSDDDRRIVGRHIARFHVKSVIQSGGMGTVYLAVQDEPRRHVALKLLRPGVTSHSALRRFRFEAQVLARLRHPGIAEIYESGTHDDGGGSVPYFAMEYIPDAKPITEYANTRGLSLRERLELFAEVCDAVAHGHRKGVIHRDLKPSNIVVDAWGRSKIIDFGVARATDSDLAVTTAQTEVGELVGTLQYMSPEQCAADPDALDARSDVYALGVILYELVCDRLPYACERGSIYEAVRIIREGEPERPSAIKRTLRGDVETIVLKALDKNPDRRYDSARDLGEDVRRHLACQPILGRRPSMLYQARVFVRRNRIAVIAVALLIAIAAVAIVLAALEKLLGAVYALGIGLFGTTLSFIGARRAAAEAARQRDEAAHQRDDALRVRQEAEADRNRAILAERAAEEARREAELAARKATAVNDFLIRDLIAGTAPAETQKREITVREVLENASRQISRAFEDQPELEAEMRDTIGTAYQSLRRFTEALTHLRAALRIRRRHLGEGHPDVADSLNKLGRLLHEMGDYEDAEPLLREALEIRRCVLGDEHPQVVVTLTDLGSTLRAMGEDDSAESLLHGRA